MLEKSGETCTVPKSASEVLVRINHPATYALNFGTVIFNTISSIPNTKVENVMDPTTLNQSNPSELLNYTISTRIVKKLEEKGV